MKQEVRVKLSGDGTCVGKRLHVVNFTFTLLDEGSKAHSADGKLLPSNVPSKGVMMK